MAKTKEELQAEADKLHEKTEQLKNLSDIVKPLTQHQQDLRDATVKNLSEIEGQIRSNAKSGDLSQGEQAVKEGQELAVEYFKSAIKTYYPDLYQDFANITYPEYKRMFDASGAGADADMTSKNTYTFALSKSGNPDFEQSQSAVQISPQMYWNNITTILNSVDVSPAFFDFGEVFNAFNFFNDGYLSSGIAKLYTQEYTATGVIMLDQNQLVPANTGNKKNATQNIAGYQVSHPIFANLPYQDAGEGLGWGLFARANVTENVWKLSVTSPAQYAAMNYQFMVLMNNSKDVAIWLISTANFLTAFTNLMVDNKNTNMRDILNGTLYPNIKAMQTPTHDYNIGDTVSITYTPASTGKPTTVEYDSDTVLTSDLSTVTTVQRQGKLKSPYLVQGYNPLTQIATSRKQDIYMIATPATYVRLKTAMLSVLYNYGMQDFNYYIPESNQKMLWRKPTITTTYLNPETSTQLSAHLIPVRLTENWITDNDIYIFTKPADVNKWPATYGYVWDDLWDNAWGAAMVKTYFHQFLIYGGTTPYAQGYRLYAKNLTKALATELTDATTLFFNEGEVIQVA